MSVHGLPAIFTTMRVIPAEVGATGQQPFLDLPLPERLVARLRDMRQQTEARTDPGFGQLQKRVPLLARHLHRLFRAAASLQEIHPEAWNHLDQGVSTEGENAFSVWLLNYLQNGLPADDGRFYRLRLELLPTKSTPAITYAVINPENQPDLCVRMDSQATQPRSTSDDTLDSFPFVHKTSERSIYSSAQARVGATLGAASFASLKNPCFDVIMWTRIDDRELITESGIANVLLERGFSGCFTTPRVTPSGPLPGVMRAELLASGVVEEAEVTKEDLVKADTKVYLCNSLRGVFEVTLDISPYIRCLSIRDCDSYESTIVWTPQYMVLLWGESVEVW